MALRDYISPISIGIGIACCFVFFIFVPAAPAASLLEHFFVSCSMGLLAGQVAITAFVLLFSLILPFFRWLYTCGLSPLLQALYIRIFAPLGRAVHQLFYGLISYIRAKWMGVTPIERYLLEGQPELPIYFYQYGNPNALVKAITNITEGRPPRAPMTQALLKRFFGIEQRMRKRSESILTQSWNIVLNTRLRQEETENIFKHYAPELFPTSPTAQAILLQTIERQTPALLDFCTALALINSNNITRLLAQIPIAKITSALQLYLQQAPPQAQVLRIVTIISTLEPQLRATVGQRKIFFQLVEQLSTYFSDPNIALPRNTRDQLLALWTTYNTLLCQEGFAHQNAVHYAKPRLHRAIEARDVPRVITLLAEGPIVPISFYQAATTPAAQLLPLTQALLSLSANPNDNEARAILQRLIAQPTLLQQRTSSRQNAFLQFLDLSKNQAADDLSVTMLAIATQFSEQNTEKDLDENRDFLTTIIDIDGENNSALGMLSTTPKFSQAFNALLEYLNTPKLLGEALFHLMKQHPGTTKLKEKTLRFNFNYIVQQPTCLFEDFWFNPQAQVRMTLGTLLAKKGFGQKLLALLQKTFNPKNPFKLYNLLVKTPELWDPNYRQLYQDCFSTMVAAGTSEWDLIKDLLANYNNKVFEDCYVKKFFTFDLNLSNTADDNHEDNLMTLTDTIEAIIHTDTLQQATTLAIIEKLWALLPIAHRKKKSMPFVLASLGLPDNSAAQIDRKINLIEIFKPLLLSKTPMIDTLIGNLKTFKNIRPEIGQANLPVSIHTQDATTREHIRTLRQLYKGNKNTTPSEEEASIAHAALVHAFNTVDLSKFHSTKVLLNPSQTLESNYHGETRLSYCRHMLKECGPHGGNNGYGVFWTTVVEEPYHQQNEPSLHYYEIIYFVWKVAFDDIVHWQEYDPHTTIEKQREVYYYSALLALIETLVNIARSHNIIEGKVDTDDARKAQSACPPGKLNFFTIFIDQFSNIFGNGARITPATITPIFNHHCATVFNEMPEKYQATLAQDWRQDDYTMQTHSFISRLLQNSEHALRAGLPNNLSQQELQMARTVYARCLSQNRHISPEMIRTLLQSWYLAAELHGVTHWHLKPFLAKCLIKAFNVPDASLDPAQALQLVDTCENTYLDWCEKTSPCKREELPVDPCKYLEDLRPKKIDPTLLSGICRFIRNNGLVDCIEDTDRVNAIIKIWKFPATTALQQQITQILSPAIDTLLGSKNIDIGTLAAAKLAFAQLPKTEQTKLTNFAATVEFDATAVDTFKKAIIALIPRLPTETETPVSVLFSAGPTIASNYNTIKEDPLQQRALPTTHKAGIAPI